MLRKQGCEALVSRRTRNGVVVAKMVVTMQAQNAWCSGCNVPMTLSDDDQQRRCGRSGQRHPVLRPVAARTSCAAVLTGDRHRPSSNLQRRTRVQPFGWGSLSIGKSLWGQIHFQGGDYEDRMARRSVRQMVGLCCSRAFLCCVVKRRCLRSRIG